MRISPNPKAAASEEEWPPDNKKVRKIFIGEICKFDGFSEFKAGIARLEQAMAGIYIPTCKLD
jgi:hypothetical protein